MIEGKGMDWINDIEYRDLLQKDPELSLIAHSCGEEVALTLALHFTKVTLYISEGFLFRLKKRYIRKFYNGQNVKNLALKLKVSERFVYDSINYTVEGDDRQKSLL